MKNIRKPSTIKFDEAFEVVMSSAHRLGTERLGIEDRGILNRILAEDIISEIDLPPFDKSAMDGFACRRADLANVLTIIETIPAGVMPKNAIAQNQCAKIMTGAVVPEGADCVIMVEDTEDAGKNKTRFKGKTTRDNICLKGEDIRKGQTILRAGCKLSAQHIAVLASQGHVKPLVSVLPRVGIIATGDELVEPSNVPQPFQIRNSNGPQLTAQLNNIGIKATNYGIAADCEEALDKIIKKAIAENDVVISSGGVSVGDYDLVCQILEKNNVRLMFEKVAVKPGRPMVFGISKAAPHHYFFGLAGNPIATYIMFELLIKPFLYKMMGHDFRAPVSLMQLNKTIKSNKTERNSWVPVVSQENGSATPIEYHGPAHISALCDADGLICIPAGMTKIVEGSIVKVRLL
jgi:molybdopterin molybdotransferase